jgi:hypothetical protein
MPVHYGSKALNFHTISSPLATQLPQVYLRLQHTSAYARWQLKAYVSIRQHTSAYARVERMAATGISPPSAAFLHSERARRMPTYADVCRRMQTQLPSCIASELAAMQDRSYVCIRRHTSEYVCIRRHTSACIARSLAASQARSLAAL